MVKQDEYLVATFPNGVVRWTTVKKDDLTADKLTELVRSM